MWRTIVDTKQGKVWANHPQSQEMKLVADADENGDVYWGWVKMITTINKAIENGHGEAVLKKVEKMFDSTIKPAYTIKSDRGNPTDL
jgi:hypothetical protein